MKHIGFISGGKDSSAMVLRLQEMHPEIDFDFVITPTGDELPPMKAHWARLEKLLGKRLIVLRDEEHPTIYDLIDHFKALPNWRQRWCTRILKIELAEKYVYELDEAAILYVGLRHDEEKRAGNVNYPIPQGDLFAPDIKQVYPLREWEWGLKEVVAYLDKRDVCIPRRTDCAMCFFQGLGEWWLLNEEYPDIYQKLIELEDRIGHTLIGPNKNQNWPHRLEDLREEFRSGRKPLTVERYKKGMCRVCTM